MTLLVYANKYMKGKEVYGHQLTAHVDKKGVIKKSVSGDKRTKFSKRRFKESVVNYSIRR